MGFLVVFGVTKFDFDRQFGASIIGVDEVGRGALAGPVTVAAVRLPPDIMISGLTDSKQLSATQRELIDHELRQSELTFAIINYPPACIDRMNILQATRAAMRDAVHCIQTAFDHVLVDGNQRIDINLPQTTVIKGDQKSAAIAAASILAKVSRDHQMMALHADYRDYNWAANKGYGTAAHRAALERIGRSPHHRQSFTRQLASRQLELL